VCGRDLVHRPRHLQVQDQGNGDVGLLLEMRLPYFSLTKYNRIPLMPSFRHFGMISNFCFVTNDL